MSTLEVQVREDGTVLIPADDVATSGAGPGQRVVIELRPRPGTRKPSRGILEGALPSIDTAKVAADRADRLAEFERRRGL
jgi:bifunctional DNA-binding transcriptional regulator/antitoxin component of YhaV-PrlF toxin-antitoxin module